MCVCVCVCGWRFLFPLPSDVPDAMTVAVRMQVRFSAYLHTAARFFFSFLSSCLYCAVLSFPCRSQSSLLDLLLMRGVRGKW
jgi:hypothetical protein